MRDIDRAKGMFQKREKRTKLDKNCKNSAKNEYFKSVGQLMKQTKSGDSSNRDARCSA